MKTRGTSENIARRDQPPLAAALSLNTVLGPPIKRDTRVTRRVVTITTLTRLPAKCVPV